MSLPTVIRAGEASAASLPAALRLGPVRLTVSALDRSVAFYQDAIGLRVHRHDAAEAELGDGEVTSVVLVEDPRARPAGRHAGLYHVALLHPGRAELARAAVRLAVTRTPIDGASDHGTHEAIYLPDPDGNGLELAADRPRAAWPTPEEEFSGGGPRPLDVQDLLRGVGGEEPAPRVGSGLRVGHVHLHVGDVPRALAFYKDVLGFDLYAELPSAAFLAAGGYHHHLGVNTWRGRGVRPAPGHVAGLREWTVELPSPANVAAVRERLEATGAAPEEREGGFAVADPWGIVVRFGVAA